MLELSLKNSRTVFDLSTHECEGIYLYPSSPLRIQLYMGLIKIDTTTADFAFTV